MMRFILGVWKSVVSMLLVAGTILSVTGCSNNSSEVPYGFNDSNREYALVIEKVAHKFEKSIGEGYTSSDSLKKFSSFKCRYDDKLVSVNFTISGTVSGDSLKAFYNMDDILDRDFMILEEPFIISGTTKEGFFAQNYGFKNDDSDIYDVYIEASEEHHVYLSFTSACFAGVYQPEFDKHYIEPQYEQHEKSTELTSDIVVE